MATLYRLFDMKAYFGEFLDPLPSSHYRLFGGQDGRCW